MRDVSNSYKESMQSSLRERGYIKVSIDIKNRDLLKTAAVSSGNFAPYSNNRGAIFKEGSITYRYAALESNLIKVTDYGGDSYFIPRSEVTNPVSDYLNSPLTSRDIITDTPFEMTITLNVPAQTINGCEIEFSQIYPVDFDIIGDSNQVIQIRGNTKVKFITEKVLVDTTQISLKVYRMSVPNSRFRIDSFSFGYELLLENKDVLESTFSQSMSPISAQLPQRDFTVKVANYDHIFDTENPASPVNFFEPGQSAYVRYGYDTPGRSDIEWLAGISMIVSEWRTDDTSCTIQLHDSLRNQNDVYYASIYNHTAREIISEISDPFSVRYIEPSLSNLYIINPIPPVSRKQALQLIANVGRCTVLYEGSYHIMVLGDSFTGSTRGEITKTDMMSYPLASKPLPIKEIVIPIYQYKNDADIIDILTKDITVSQAQTYMFKFDEPYVLSTVQFVTESGETVSLEECDRGFYFVKLLSNINATGTLTVKGMKLILEKREYVKSVNANGKSIRWDNPLVSDETMATNLADWLEIYYNNRVEYEYATRGNPEFDAGDVLLQANNYSDNLRAIICESVINFNGSFSGRLRTMKVGE